MKEVAHLPLGILFIYGETYQKIRARYDKVGDLLITTFDDVATLAGDEGAEEVEMALARYDLTYASIIPISVDTQPVLHCSVEFEVLVSPSTDVPFMTMAGIRPTSTPETGMYMSQSRSPSIEMSDEEDLFSIPDLQTPKKTITRAHSPSPTSGLPFSTSIRWERCLHNDEAYLSPGTELVVSELPRVATTEFKKMARYLIDTVNIQIFVQNRSANIIVPLRKDGVLEDLKWFMMATYGFAKDDSFSVEDETGNAIAWETKIGDIWDNRNGLKLNLKIPDEHGSANVFKKIDLQNQRVLHKEILMRSMKRFALNITEADVDKIWTFLDHEQQGVISFSQFQNIISDEVNMNDFMSGLLLLARTPKDEYDAFLQANNEIKKRYILAMTTIPSDEAKLERITGATNIYGIFGAFDPYVEGAIEKRLFRREAELAGLKLDAVQIDILLSKICRGQIKEYFVIDDFLAIMNGREACLISDFIDNINHRLSKVDKTEYNFMHKRIFRSKQQESRENHIYEESKRTPRDILGLEPFAPIE